MARNEQHDRPRDSEGRYISNEPGGARNESHGPQHGSMGRQRDEDGRFTSDSAPRGGARGEGKSDDMKRTGR